MAIPRENPEQAVFLVGVLAADRARLDIAGRALEREFGLPDLAMAARPFTSTSYYIDELGPEPVRSFLAFPGAFPTDALVDRKLAANRLEAEIAAADPDGLPRPVNLDPGYLTQAKLVLASAKNFSHRIHLSRGIFAEVTLQYIGNAFHSLPWTFPDYASGDYFPFLIEVRKRIAPCQAKSKPN